MICMPQCIYAKECSYLNNTIKHQKGFKDIFKANYCSYYYTKCAIWQISQSNGMENVPKNLLPFQYTMVDHNRV